MSTQVQAPGWYDDPVGQARFRYWDGVTWTHQTTNAKDPTAGVAALGPGFARLGDWVGRCLIVVAVLAVAVAVVLLWGGSMLNPYGASLPSLTQTDSAALTPELKSDLMTVWVALLIALASYSLITMVTGVMWWVWQYQLAVSAPAALRRGPAMHLISWMIPIVNLWWPYQNMTDLWKSYGAGKDPTNDVPSGIGLWWAAYIGLPVVAWTVSFALTFSATPDNWVMRLATAYALMAGVMAVSAVLARGVVNRLSWRALEFWHSL